jgi:hypothetical protein
VKLGTSREHLLPHLGRRHPFKAKKLEIDAASAVKRVWDPKPVASRGRREVWFIIDNPPLRLIVSFQGVDPL